MENGDPSLVSSLGSLIDGEVSNTKLPGAHTKAMHGTVIAGQPLCEYQFSQAPLSITRSQSVAGIVTGDWRCICPSRLALAYSHVVKGPCAAAFLILILVSLQRVVL